MSSGSELTRPPIVNQLTLQIIVWVSAFIASMFTVARIAIRSYKFRRIFSDDILVIVALAMLLAAAVLYQMALVPMYTLLRVAAGLEPLEADFMELGTKYLKYQFAITCLFWSILWTVKLSFLAFFRRLSTGLKQHETAWWIVLVFVLLSYTGCIITYPISCSSFTVGDCESAHDIWVSSVSLKYSTVVDVTSDLFIMVLPIHLLWNVKISVRQKLGLAGIFSLGIIIVVFAIVRIIVTNTVHTHVEPTWLGVWSALESSVAVSVCCLASFKSLFTKAGSSNGSGYGSNAYTPGHRSRRSRGDVPSDQRDAVEMNGTRSSAFSAPSGKKHHAKEDSASSASSGDTLCPERGVHVRTDLHVVHEPANLDPRLERIRRESETSVREPKAPQPYVRQYPGREPFTYPPKRGSISSESPRSEHSREHSAALRTSTPPIFCDKSLPGTPPNRIEHLV